jgi:hypothetical protein
MSLVMRIASRVRRVERVQLREHPPQAVVTARPRSAALDAKAVALAHHMKIRQMSHAPCATCMRAGVEAMEIAGLGHCRIGDCPYERGSREIDGDQHDAVGQSHGCQ